jgi:hypothetical protein
MAGRRKIESLMQACDGLFQILHLAHSPKLSGKGRGEVIEIGTAIWMAERTKIKGLSMGCDGVLQILDLA